MICFLKYADWFGCWKERPTQYGGDARCNSINLEVSRPLYNVYGPQHSYKQVHITGHKIALLSLEAKQTNFLCSFVFPFILTLSCCFCCCCCCFFFLITSFVLFFLIWNVWKLCKLVIKKKKIYGDSTQATPTPSHVQLVTSVCCSTNAWWRRVSQSQIGFNLFSNSSIKV